MAINKRHGGPYDRGSADAYYRRPANPHYYEGPTRATQAIFEMTDQQVKEYNTGYRDQVASGSFKYGDEETNDG